MVTRLCTVLSIRKLPKIAEYIRPDTGSSSHRRRVFKLKKTFGSDSGIIRSSNQMKNRHKCQKCIFTNLPNWEFTMFGIRKVIKNAYNISCPHHVMSHQLRKVAMRRHIYVAENSRFILVK